MENSLQSCISLRYEDRSFKDTQPHVMTSLFRNLTSDDASVGAGPVLLILLVILFPLTLSDDFILQGVNRDVYARPGDINIGSIMLITGDATDAGCSKRRFQGSWGIEYPEAVAFVAERVNNDPELLPNVTLGFYILDDCSSRQIALAQSLSFLPRSVSACQRNFCETSPNGSSDALTSPHAEEVVPFYDVVGILAPMQSITAVPVSYLLSAAKMPMVGFTTSTDELSDKTLHPYYVRVISPDRFQATAILKFISDNNWSYISVVYSQGPYGERGFDSIKASAPGFNICIAASHRIDDSVSTDAVVRSLLSFRRARVVVMFADELAVRRVFASVQGSNATGHFIWIASDSMASMSQETFAPYKDIIIGAFTFLFYSPLVPEFYDYILRQNVLTSPNPWFKPAWEDLTNCSFSSGSCDPDADIVRASSFAFMLSPSLAMDAVLTFAHAAHRLISDLCPGATGRSARECVKGDVLFRYIRNVSFVGYTGNITFDVNGDVSGRYIIHQIRNGTIEVPLGFGNPNASSEIGFVSVAVAFYDIPTGNVMYTSTKISWDHLRPEERVRALADGEVDTGIPESVCSRPCAVGEYRIQKQLECCWECRTCRDNEKIVNGNSSCEECELFTWPDPATGFTTCSPIPLSYPSISGTLSVIQIALAVLALASTALVAASYVYFRESRVIKASSRELSVLQLAAIFVGYLTVICFQSAPTPSTCAMLYFMFCLSFAWLYSPLLVKAVRVYRIFQSGSKNNKRPRFVSPQSQVVMATSLILIQVILCIVMYVMYQPTARRTQPVTTEKFVELTCDMTLPGLASFLAYNLVLVALCSVFAFKTRKLPDNFNESRFTSMCVSTTLVIWLAFVPTYFTAGREFVRALLLSVALLLNHTVALVFLFLPKVFASIYVPSDQITVTRLNTGLVSQHHPCPGGGNRVGPSSGPEVALGQGC